MKALPNACKYERKFKMAKKRTITEVEASTGSNGVQTKKKKTKKV